MKASLSTVLQIGGAVVVTVGVFLFSVPLGFIVGGALLILFGVAAEYDTSTDVELVPDGEGNDLEPLSESDLELEYPEET